MARLVEPAAAKVNLTLEVLGRRGDGYHELRSLVAFASCGDEVALVPGGPFVLTCEGPFAAALGDGQNLVERAVMRALAEARDLRTGAFELTKNIPVAAGLGGGSADAAAALRLLKRANPARAAAVDWPAVATALGADVPVCLASRSAMMSGFGERVTPLVALPDIAVLLANPGLPLATADVFRGLGAPPLAEPSHSTVASLPPVRALDDLVVALRASRNDLEPVAARLCPPVAQVLAALRMMPGALLARMSGSGPTCFALFRRIAEAEAARGTLASAEPGWWVAAATLR